ncbi:dipeptide ABC transporter ATP-binding protein [Dactylosporangium sp. CA-233914]|uniref:dipeptide ABC transporter ATP-binding protein n=1 Tax=Dactylosporangium sp. CA-233914 TaxID=3239934 RepID=UPI003D91E97D
MSQGLSVSGLTVTYRSGHRPVTALDGASFDIPAGHRLAIVGESGSGKSTLGLALMGLLPPTAQVSADRVLLGGDPIDLNDQSAMRALRGRAMSMVFQDAKSSLDPVRTVGYQIAEALKAHHVVPRKQIWPRVEELLSEVEISQPALRARQYPHELSGGMRQRAMIATALAGQPRVLIADEPTSALDVTTQATVMDLMGRLADTAGMTTLLITHDLALVAGFADSVLVLYAGRVAEFGTAAEVFNRPAHPYTRALLASIPSLGTERQRILGSIPGRLPDLTAPVTGCVFEPRCAKGNGQTICRTVAPQPVTLPGGGTALCHFAHDPNDAPVDLVVSGRSAGLAASAGSAEAAGARGRQGPAAPAGPGRQDGTPERDGAPEGDREVAAGDVVAGAGRPGGGAVLELRGVSKTFSRGAGWGRKASRVHAVSQADLVIEPGESVGIVGESGSGKTTLARIVVGLERSDSGNVSRTGKRGFAQMVFQDPGDSLNPLMSIGDVISEPLVLRDGGGSRRYRADVVRLLDAVGLQPEMAARRPSELSGGQRQRVAIARALATQPKLIVADEAVASLDMSARGQILNLLTRLQDEYGFAYLYISHDLSMVRHVCDRVVVMYAGRIVETAPVDSLFAGPRHPYTRALIDAVPVPRVGERPVRTLLRGELSGQDSAAGGCAFRFRCPLAQERCETETPVLRDGQGHATACHFAV